LGVKGCADAWEAGMMVSPLDRAHDRAADGADLGSNDEQDSRNSIFNGHWEALFLSRKEGEHAEWHNVDISEMDW